MTKTELSVINGAFILALTGILIGSLTSQSALAGGLIALAPVIVIAYQSIQTRRAVAIGQREADASLALAQETRRDRELAVQQFLALGDRADDTALGPGVSLRNIGRGLVLDIRVLVRRDGKVFWNRDAVVLATGESLPSSTGSPDLPLIRLMMQASARGVSDYVVSSMPPHDLVAYCGDQLGNRLRFNLRTADPPSRWRSQDEEAPEWAAALDYR